MHYYVHISSVTGNTKRVADYVLSHINTEDITYIDEDFLHSWTPPQEPYLFVMFYWCRRASLDPVTIQMIELLHNQPILAIGTLGSYDQGPYADRVRKNLEELIGSHNRCQGIFFCRGKIAIERTMRRRNLPTNHIHYLSDEGYERHLSSHSHPDSNDLENAWLFFQKYIVE